MAKKFKVIDGCPVDARLYPELVAIKKAAGYTNSALYNSIYRGDDARALLNKHGKSSQKQLYILFQQGRGNPANPPGYSTHEERNDGVAYRKWPRGARIPYWAVGIDSRDPRKLMEAARKRGWTVTLTYPNNPREAHHCNFRKEPKLKLFRALRKGSRGPRVATMTARLAYLGYLDGVSPRRGTGGFGPRVEAAVKRFQKRHQQKVDGIYGIHTHRQLLASVAHTKRSRKAAK